MDYSIENIRKTFLEHSEKSLKDQENQIAKFRENNPGNPLPEHFTDNFCLPLALASMCNDIIYLYEQVHKND